MAEYETHDDIHYGMEITDVEEKPIIFSVGHRCTTASLIKIMKMKFESYPFDWVVSKLETVKYCIENNFNDFLQSEHYIRIDSDTTNVVDNEELFVTNESIVFNKKYESNILSETNCYKPNYRGTYDYMLALTHHDMHDENNKQYFGRCIKRFQNILKLTKRKFYLYVNPLIGNNDFKMTSANTLIQFINFTEFMKNITTNSFGIYFFVVRNNCKKGTVEKMYETEDMVVFIMNCNDNLIDAGGVFDGDFYDEQYKMLITIENIVKI